MWMLVSVLNVTKIISGMLVSLLRRNKFILHFYRNRFWVALWLIRSWSRLSILSVSCVCVCGDKMASAPPQNHNPHKHIPLSKHLPTHATELISNRQYIRQYRYAAKQKQQQQKFKNHTHVPLARTHARTHKHLQLPWLEFVYWEAIFFVSVSNHSLCHCIDSPSTKNCRFH